MSQGDIITIVVSGGPNDVSVPPVAGLVQEDALSLLTRVEYAFDVRVMEENSATIAAGTAIRTDPVSGSILQKGAPVILYISKGPEQVAMPALVGLSEGQARNLLADLGLIADDSVIRFNGSAVSNFTGFDLDFQITANGQPLIGNTVSPDIFDNVSSDCRSRPRTIKTPSWSVTRTADTNPSSVKTHIFLLITYNIHLIMLLYRLIIQIHLIMLKIHQNMLQIHQNMVQMILNP